MFVRGSRPASLSGRKPPLIPPYQGGKKLSPFGVALLPYREWKQLPFGRVRPDGRFVAVVPLIRGIPPKGGGGFAVVPLRASTSRKGGGFVCSGESPCFPVGKKTPLNPPLSGGQKALPLRGRLASLSGMKTAPLRASTSRREVCCRCPPDKGGGGFVCSGESPCFPIGNETGSPSGRFLNPPLSGGQKALPLRGRLASLSGMKTAPLIRGVTAIVMED